MKKVSAGNVRVDLKHRCTRVENTGQGVAQILPKSLGSQGFPDKIAIVRSPVFGFIVLLFTSLPGGGGGPTYTPFPGVHLRFKIVLGSLVKDARHIVSGHFNEI